MAKSLFIDCISGLSGDMFLGGLADLGLSARDLAPALRKLRIGPFSLRFESVMQKSIRARRLKLHLSHPHSRHNSSHGIHSHQSYRDIVRRIRAASLPHGVTDRALSIFKVLAEAEGKIHGIEPGRVEFHEVGAVDSIVDIVGAAIGLDRLDIDTLYASPVPLGSGFVTTQHGTYPIPAPATLELLKGFPIREHPESGELTTPTGAAILKALAKPLDTFPSLLNMRIGYGAGSRQGVEVPNVVRLVLGHERSQSGSYERDEIWVVETNLDDMTPELCAPLLDRLMREGALDVQLIPAHMKQGRPGFLVQILSPLELREALVRVLFEESTTLGVRFHRSERWKVPRRIETVSTRFGPIRVKVSVQNGRLRTAKPELADLVRAAAKYSRPVREVLQTVERVMAARSRLE